jgi:dihydrofolate reductase
MISKKDNSIKIIAAVSLNNVIGVRNELPWVIKEDLKHFRELTENNTIIMGWNTWQSLGEKPLPNRVNIVLSHNMRILPKDVLHISNPLQLFYPEILRKVQGSLFVIGGAQVYQLFMPMATDLYITKVYLEIEETEDVIYFPKIGNEWKEFGNIMNSTENGIFFEYKHYVRSKL